MWLQLLRDDQPQERIRAIKTSQIRHERGIWGAEFDVRDGVHAKTFNFRQLW